MKDRKIAKGIYRTSSGWRVFARVKGKLYSKRIEDGEHASSLSLLKDERDALRLAAKREQKVPPPSTPGTFANDVRARYLPAVQKRVNLSERTYHMELWVQEFGPRPSRSIEPWEIAKVRERWLTEGPKRICRKWPKGERPAGVKTGRWVEIAAPLSARQVNNRLRALENFYTVLFPNQPNPVREAGEAVEVQPPPRQLDYSLFDAILAAMPDRGRAVAGGDRPDVSLTKLRLFVFRHTGFSHIELAGIEDADLHLDQEPPWVWVKGRRKGKGTTGVAQPLTAEGAKALRALRDAGGLGSFSNDSMLTSWHRGCRAIGLTAPFPRPYDIRHAFATHLLHATKSLTALQLNMRHRDARTSRRYAELAIDPVRLAGLQAAERAGAFTSAAPPVDERAKTKPPGERSSHSTSRRTRTRTPDDGRA